jgi:hypothetical protein
MNVNIALQFALCAFLALIGFNAVGGGVYGLAGAEGIPIEWLQGSPFSTYFVPSLVLLVAVGGAFSFAAIAVITGARVALRATAVAVAIGVVWLLAELAIIGPVSWLQPATAGTLVLIVALAIAQHMRAQSPRAQELQAS